MATLSEVIRLMGVMSLAYSNYVPKEGASKVYYMLLEDIPVDALEAGMKSAMVNSNGFFPDAGQWRRAALDISMAKGNTPSAIEAWGEVLQQFEDTGYYKEPKFSHTLIEYIVRQMGWQNLCMSENAIADRARFLQAYDAAVLSNTQESRMLPSVRTVAEKYQLGEANNMIKRLAEGMKHD
jgi:hypothetical protein